MTMNVVQVHANPGPTKRVAALYRVSTKKQLEPSENGGDIPTQQKACQEFIESHAGWTLTKEYYEKGVSGFKKKASERDVIQRVLFDAENDEFDVLLVFMFDRLGRREDDTPFILQALVGFGVEVWSVTEGEQRFDNHTDKLLAYIRSWQSSGESYKTSIRVDEAHRQMVQEGRFRGGAVPYGYRTKPSGKFNKKGKELLEPVIIPEQAAIVRLIYRLIVEEGYGQNRIAMLLNERGHKTNKGNPWSSSFINTLVKHPIYKGYIVYARGEENEVYSREQQADLVIVDEGTWNRAQEIRAKRIPENTKKEDQECVIRSTKGSLLLIGMARCGYCKNPLTSTWNKKNYKRADGTIHHKRYAKYRCSGKALRKVECSGQTVYSQFKLESIVLSEVYFYLDRLATVDLSKRMEEMRRQNLGNEEREVRRRRNELDTERTKLEKLMDEVIKVISGESQFSRGTLEEAIAKTKDKISELEIVLQKAEKALTSKKIEEAEIKTLQQYVPVWRKVFDQASDAKKKMMLATIIDCVRVFRDRVEVDFRLRIDQFLGTMECAPTKQDHLVDEIMSGKVLTANSIAKNG
jgi:DNA invertase Pin-like site-specific DNA recombinase/flagellar biosynthesis chaperone FliJ